jgi:PilZ domain
MGLTPLDYTSCEDCRGSGKKDDGSPCPRCEGTGMMAVGEPHRPENREEKWTTGKRRFPRYRTNLPLTVPFRERDLEGRCKQIAEGGLGAFLPEPVPVGSVVLLQLVVPTYPTELHVQAVIRYQIGFQHGLEFLSLNEGERLAIRQFCRELPSASRA